VLADLVSTSSDAGKHPASARELFAAAAAPRPGRVAFAVLGTDYSLRLLGPALEPVLPDVPAVGVGFALADLDGDGEPELVASAAKPGSVDRARVLRLGPELVVEYESSDVEGAFVAGAAADVTGDGLDDVILAAALPGGGTQLWLVTAEARPAWP
jgi:hypothetical protein